jgi:transaldolase
MSKQLSVAIYADGANRDEMVRRANEGLVKGFTTNPSLMAKAGIRDYEGFAREILTHIPILPISFEVFSDVFTEMERQALVIKSWGDNVNVKIPITNTKGESSLPLIKNLLRRHVKLNVTAIFTQEQLDGLREVLTPEDDVIVSIFAGRIADTGIDPMPLMHKAVQDFRPYPRAKVLWASTREALNIYQADECGCQIITVTDDLIGKLKLYGKSLSDFSKETVLMFYQDAQKAGFRL